MLAKIFFVIIMVFSVVTGCIFLVLLLSHQINDSEYGRGNFKKTGQIDMDKERYYGKME